MSDDILARIDEVMARNAERFHPFGPVRPPVSRPLALPYRCRGCRLWIAQDVKLCGPCSALPSCLAERSAAEWGGLAKCFRPGGHDGQHESVQGRCWMDAPSQIEPLRREPFLMPAIDAERDLFVRRLEAELAKLLPVAPPARRPWWKRLLP
jgi:hypothetical protein